MKKLYTIKKTQKAAKSVVRISTIILMVLVWILIDKGNVHGQSQFSDTHEVKNKRELQQVQPNALHRLSDSGEGDDLPLDGSTGTAFTIKPNPVQADLVFDFEFTVKEAIPVTVFDPMGKRILQYTFEPGVNSQKLNLEQLPTGVYIVQLEIAGKTKVKKIIKK